MNKLVLCTKYITLPGAMMRATIEHITCKFCGIPVEDNRILTKNELFGHVEHELAPTARKSFALAFVPAFVNFVFALILFLPSMLSLFYFQFASPLMMVVNIVAYYFGFSLMCNSYPLIEDALNMKEKIYGKPSDEEADKKKLGYGNIFQKIIYAPGFAFLYVLSKCEEYGFTFIFWTALTVAIGIVTI